VAQSFDDRVEQEVRKRLTLAASAAGVDRGRIELEILYLLPPQFVRNYRELFDRALADPIKPATDGGKDEGRVRAPGKPGDPLKARHMGGAAPGKKFVHGAWPIRNEAAVEAKRRLDKKLLAAVLEALELVRGSIGAAGAANESSPNRCQTCGFFLKPDWIRCPYHI
jgi:hypothetical protein